MISHEFRVVITDFDGVILESEKAKDKAFHSFFEQFPEHIAREIFSFHMSNKKISRYDKLNHLFNNILPAPPPVQKQKRLKEILDEMILSHVCEANEIPGANDFLKQAKGYNIPVYVVSGTPFEQLRLVLKEKRLLSFFKHVFGGASKPDTIKEIINAEKVNNSQTFYAGDLIYDQQAADEVKTPFIGIGEEIFDQHLFSKYKDWNDLLDNSTFKKDRIIIKRREQ